GLHDADPAAYRHRRSLHQHTQRAASDHRSSCAALRLGHARAPWSETRTAHARPDPRARTAAPALDNKATCPTRSRLRARDLARDAAPRVRAADEDTVARRRLARSNLARAHRSTSATRRACL